MITVAEIAKAVGTNTKEVANYLRSIGYTGPIKRSAEIEPPFFAKTTIHLMKGLQK